MATYVLPMGIPNVLDLTTALTEYWDGSDTLIFSRAQGAYINGSLKPGHSFELDEM